MFSAHSLSLELAKFRLKESYTTFKFLNSSHISMLHPDALAVLNILSSSCSNILEIGPCKGGSTIALCTNNNNHVITIEKDSTHIVDLKSTFILYDVSNQVTLLEGCSYSSEILQRVSSIFNNKKISLLVIDSDGCVKRDLLDFYSFLDSQCYLVIDDYYSPLAKEKEQPTQDLIDTLLVNNIVESLGIYGWGTFVGKLIDKPRLENYLSDRA